jgi:hypothetical protein
MKKGFLIPMLLGVSVLAGVSGPAAQTVKPEPMAAKPEAMAARHTMDGTVTKVDAKNGWIDVKTPEGSMKLHFPSPALDNVKAGDSVTVELGMTRLASRTDTKTK